MVVLGDWAFLYRDQGSNSLSLSLSREEEEEEGMTWWRSMAERLPMHPRRFAPLSAVNLRVNKSGILLILLFLFCYSHA